MKVILLGVLLMGVGGGLMSKDYFTQEEKHEANILGAEVSVTTTERSQIPREVSGMFLIVGGVVAVAGALRSMRK